MKFKIYKEVDKEKMNKLLDNLNYCRGCQQKGPEDQREYYWKLGDDYFWMILKELKIPEPKLIKILRYYEEIVI